jgi:hypothetical protein
VGLRMTMETQDVRDGLAQAASHFYKLGWM